MDHLVFMQLVDLLREYSTPERESFRNDTITAEKRVAIVLYYFYKIKVH